MREYARGDAPFLLISRGIATHNVCENAKHTKFI